MKYSKILKNLKNICFGYEGYAYGPHDYAIPHASQPAVYPLDFGGQVYPIAEPYTDNLKEVATEPNVNA